MAPKAKDKAKAKAKKAKDKVTAEPITMPNVSAKEVADAEKVLKDEFEKRRANSNMMYWLQSQEKRDQYDALSPKLRKEFALSWYAWSLREGDTSKVSKRALGAEKKEKDIGKWMSKQELINKYGETKAASKVAALDLKPARHRPDRDTQDDGEWHREYRIFEDETEENNFDVVTKELRNTKECNGETERVEAEEDMNSFKLLNEGGANTAAASSGESQPEKRIKVEGEMTDEDLKTFGKLKTNPKAVLRTVQENVTEMKRMFEISSQPSKAKYTEIIRTDITKLLPKLKADYTAVEKLHLSQAKSEDEAIPDPEVLATARKLDKNFLQISEITTWFRRMCPKDNKASK